MHAINNIMLSLWTVLNHWVGVNLEKSNELTRSDGCNICTLTSSHQSGTYRLLTVCILFSHKITPDSCTSQLQALVQLSRLELQHTSVNLKLIPVLDHTGSSPLPEWMTALTRAAHLTLLPEGKIPCLYLSLDTHGLLPQRREKLIAPGSLICGCCPPP